MEFWDLDEKMNNSFQYHHKLIRGLTISRQIYMAIQFKYQLLFHVVIFHI